MVNFRTVIPFQAERNQIDYNSQLFLVGSCFSEHIGNKLNYYKFNILENPFGILFHPKAIEKLILNAVNEEVYTEKDSFQLNNQWHCFDAHSRMSDASEEKLLQNLNNAIQLTNHQIRKSTHCIITLGTAWVYRHIETDKLVGNCHKVPQKKFLKELSSVDQIRESLEAIIELIKSVNPTINIVFTISPVRHLKDGFVENQRSKAHLITAVQELVNPSPLIRSKGKVFYFPSYELMIDELRDYRYYEEDMIHPSKVAIDYIWEKFKEVWISKDSISIMETVESIQKGLNHRPFNPESDQHQKFLKNLQDKILYLQTAYPFIKF